MVFSHAIYNEDETLPYFVDDMDILEDEEPSGEPEWDNENDEHVGPFPPFDED